MLSTIDSILNKYTMYKVALYSLCAYVGVSYILAGLGLIGVSLVGLLSLTAVLGVACYLSNKFFAQIMRIPTGSESYAITALILVCILPPRFELATLAYSALVGVAAMASKYLIVYKGSHIFNPAAFGALVVSLVGLLPVIWWVATPWMTPFTILLALVLLRKQRQFKLFFVFALFALVTLLLVSTGGGANTSYVEVLRSAFFSWPILFFGSVMLTEPNTLPRSKSYQLVLAGVVGLLFSSQLTYQQFGTTPQAVLIFANLLVAILIPNVGAITKVRGIRKIGSDVYEVVIEKPKGFVFIAGQYMQLTLSHKNSDLRGNRRVFSILSAPTDQDLKIAFRQYDKSSSFKKALVDMMPSQTIRIGNVSGDFNLPSKNTPLLFIAGGIGITPFISMIKALKVDCDIVLLYQANKQSDFIYNQELNAAEAKGVKTKYITEKLTPEAIRLSAGDYGQRLVYISGPSSMVKSYKKMLLEIGVSKNKIKTDYFTGY